MIQLITILLFDKKEKKKKKYVKCVPCTMYLSVEEQLRLLFFFYEETWKMKQLTIIPFYSYLSSLVSFLVFVLPIINIFSSRE